MNTKGLVLRLAPGERVLINGAVIENGARRSHLLVITPQAHILRLRDAIDPADATTPIKRLCLVAQKAVAGQIAAEEGRTQLLAGVKALPDAWRDRVGPAALRGVIPHVSAGRFYPALQLLRGMLPLEETLLQPAMTKCHEVEGELETPSARCSRP